MSLDDAFVPESGVEIDLGVNLDDIPPQHAAPEGEYRLILSDVEIGESEKTGGRYIRATLEIADDPDAKLISHIMMLPASDDKERKRKNRLRAIGDFYKAFGIPSSGVVKLDQYLGNQGFAILRIDDDKEYGEQNRIRRFVTGK